MGHALPSVTKEENIWLLRLRQPNGRIQEYRCTTEDQARQFALMLAPSEQEAPSAQAR